MPEHFEFLGADLRPEAQLLLCCLRTQMDADNAARIIRLLQENIDWGYLLEMAFHHKLAPLLYRSLEAVAPTIMPETVRAELKKQIQVDIQGALFLTKELLHLLALFGRHGISALPYKGPTLAVSVYRDLTLRPFTDLDILVHKRDVLQAMDLLVSCGYEMIRPPPVAQAEKCLQSRWISQLVEKSRWAYQLVLWHPDRQVIVELHWRIAPEYVFPSTPEQLWENLKPVTVAGVSVLSFAPENLLWFLCVHGAKHHWGRLNWLCDIAELIRVSPDLNWEQIVSQTTKLGVERRLYLGLFLAHNLFKIPLPKAIATKIYAAPYVKVLAQQVIDRVFDDTERIDRFPDLEPLAFQLRAMDRLADRGGYLLHLAKGIEAAAAADRAYVKQPSFLSLFAYLRRPLRLAKTYGLSLLKCLFKIRQLAFWVL